MATTLNFTSTNLSGFLETDYDQLVGLFESGTYIVDTFDVATGAFKINSVAVSSTAAELNILDGVTAVTADLNIIAGGDAAGITSTEFGYINGVTSAIQTQMDTKAPLASPTFTTAVGTDFLTASEVMISDGSKNMVSAPVAT